MGLIAYTDADTFTGVTTSITKPVYAGAGVQVVADSNEQNTGIFGFLDKVGDKLGDFAGRAVDLYEDKWASEIKPEKNETVVQTPDITIVQPDAALSGNGTPSFFEQNKMLVIGGGAAALLLIALVVLRK